MLAIIPARGGSKGLPNKNFKLLNGKPLIEYTILAAIKSMLFEKIIVSTDSEQIADIASACGAEVPFIRPVEISGDNTSSDDVVLHALQYFEKQNKTFQEICKLQPTSPLRDEKHIREAYDLMLTRKASFVVSVCECEHSPLWAGTLDSQTLRMDNFIKPEVKRVCRQELQTYYRLNGAIYMGKTDAFKINKSFLGENSVAYIMSQKYSVDIDNAEDFEFAAFLMNKKIMTLYGCESL